MLVYLLGIILYLLEIYFIFLYNFSLYNIILKWASNYVISKKLFY